jgi:hypothetical protein
MDGTATLAGPVDFVTDPITDVVGGGAKALAGQILSMLGSSILSGLANACSQVAHGVLGFMDASSGIDLESGWWAGDRARAVTNTVFAIAVGLAVLFAFLALLQGLLAGDVGAMIRLVVKEIPAAAVGTVLVGVVATLLLKLTDAASASVLAGAPGDMGAFLQRLTVPGAVAGHGLLGGIVLVVFLLAGLFVWVELLVRSALLYLLIAFAPLALAARVWPVSRGAFRRLCELGVALIASKFAVAVALALGAAALAGGGPEAGGAGGDAGAVEAAGISLGSMLAGASLMALAAFTPFVVLRLLPILETAVIAQGVSRSPVRAAQSGAQAVYYTQGLQRMAAGSRPNSVRPAPSLSGMSAGPPPTPPAGLSGGAGSGSARPTPGSAPESRGVRAGIRPVDTRPRRNS